MRANTIVAFGQCNSRCYRLRLTETFAPASAPLRSAMTVIMSKSRQAVHRAFSTDAAF
jgi:hypothetical protein